MIQTSEGNPPQGWIPPFTPAWSVGARWPGGRGAAGAVRSALCLALVLGLFAGGERLAGLAAAMEELILGRLVQVFRVTRPAWTADRLPQAAGRP